MSRPFLLIGLAGPAESGKKTVAGYLAEIHGLVRITLPAPLFGPLQVAERKLAELRAAPAHLHIIGAVVTNLHFEHEADWLRAQGGVVWHLFRPSAGHTATAVGVHQHPGDSLIWNNGTRLELCDQVSEIADRLLTAMEAA
jgi:hypothetical protein